MLSAFLVRPGQIELRECPVPEPGRGEIVVKVICALTCGTDLKAYLRGHDLIPMPGPFGHEFSGIVSRTGKGVRKFRESDEVMAVHSAPCNACDYCSSGSFNLCRNIMETKILGAFSEYILIPEHIVKQNTYLKPSHLPFEEAAMLEPLACVVHAYGRINISSVRRALVIGVGPIGLLHLLYLKSKGIEVTISDLNAERLTAGISMGADKAVSPSDLKDLNPGPGIDLVVECTGQPEIWQLSVSYVRRGGTVILFGGCKSGTSVNYAAGRLHYDEITMMGSFHFSPLDVRNAYNLLAKGRINSNPLLSGLAGIREIGDIFEKLRRGEGLKYAIHP